MSAQRPRQDGTRRRGLPPGGPGGPRGRGRTRRPLLALVALIVLLAVGYALQATRSPGGRPSPASVTVGTTTSTVSAPSSPISTPSVGPSQATALSSLPLQAQQTVRLVQAGGPFPYARDGIVFGNFQHLLPTQRSGYYHEYTVRTPGESDRGARRVISGRAGEIYYTADHYATFVRVDPDR